MHLEHALHPDFQLGHWQARLEVDASPPQVTDHGKMWPVTLPAVLRPDLADTSRVFSMQSLVISWRNQVHRHAAVSLPPVVPLQISRFTPEGAKLRGRIVLTPVIHIPLFTDSSARTTSCKYQLHAVTYHLGPNMHSGHYRTLLFKQGAPFMVTDDNMFPVPVSEVGLEEVMNNSYLAFYCRSDIA